MNNQVSSKSNRDGRSDKEEQAFREVYACWFLDHREQRRPPSVLTCAMRVLHGDKKGGLGRGLSAGYMCRNGFTGEGAAAGTHRRRQLRRDWPESGCSSSTKRGRVRARVETYDKRQKDLNGSEEWILNGSLKNVI
ncbi:hypothetical protein HanOQP8_Chr02g0049021 [Helianthus annuus]|nr:hypothetical protein HanOQP8_Chr02g0049021 [Helianthus annuus]